jgi:alkylhydroperoxidase/carboxymuconolactone decarboxylase family protein YurZ
LLIFYGFDNDSRKGENMAARKKVQIDFEYEEVLDAKTRRLVHVGSAVAAGCPT